MTINCAHCGTPFEAKRNDAKFCSPKCKMAHHRLANLTWEGTLIRGQHEMDIPTTGSGIEKACCLQCAKPFSRWIETKVARLVRNELEGSVHWENRDFDHAEFERLKAIRMEEMKFCSDECQQAYNALPTTKRYLNPPIPLPENPQDGDLYTPEGDEMQLEKGILRVRRRFVSKKKAELMASAAPDGTATFPKRRGQ